ncbi:MAG: DUF6263 family protein [Bacteroidales bacterium]|jgi:hypothetical protein|nr:DUF6263 family protein [Bacteroidales bacterium]MDD4257967.1 DUF6263 family protein [Bacteroidales bacterium]MDD4655030.1 DUF6263 family protein [Bacteroidales bacterium]MDD4828722.1 DUF6263 family protein [Bacteroidales bacterium]HNY23269.1 DUF6263 family protein [Bacteroidales bacterium]
MKRIFSLLFIFAAVALQAQTFRLEFKPVAGTEYPVNMEVIQDMTIKVPAMGDMTTHTEQKIGAILTLVEEVEKGYLMETRLTRFTVNTSAQGQSQNFDSEGEDVVSQAIKTITEKPFRLVISRQGEVVEMLPLDTAFFTRADETLATQYAKRKRETTMTQLKALFSESTLKNVAQAGLTKFPDKDLKVPSVWTEDTPSDELGAIITTQYRVDNYADNKVTLMAKMVLMSNPNAKKPEGPQRMENIAGGGEATNIVDAVSGWVIETKGKQNVSGQLVIEQGGQSQSLDLTMVISTVITR